MRVVQMNAALMSAFDFTLRVKAKGKGRLVKPTHCCVSLCITQTVVFGTLQAAGPPPMARNVPHNRGKMKDNDSSLSGKHTSEYLKHKLSLHNMNMHDLHIVRIHSARPELDAYFISECRF